jgi:trehalose 6-phosphate synthase/phosphatase
MFETQFMQASMLDVTLDRRDIPDQYRATRKRLVILDYDGVLVPRRQAGIVVPPREAKAVVQLLSGDRQNTVMLLTGSDKSDLEVHWAPFHSVLVSEHGASYREPEGEWRSVFDIDSTWVDGVASSIEPLTLQYSGSMIERRTHSLLWDYSGSRPALGEDDLTQIIGAIRALPQHGKFDIYQHQAGLELGPPGVDPGSFFARWIGGKKFDFVIAVGAGRTEKSLFRILTNEAVTVSVSPAMTSASRYWLRSQTEVAAFLTSLPAS